MRKKRHGDMEITFEYKGRSVTTTSDKLSELSKMSAEQLNELLEKSRERRRKEEEVSGDED